MAFQRYAITLIFLAPVILCEIRNYRSRTRRYGLHTARGVLYAIGVILWFYAMAHIPVAEVTAPGFTAPIFATIGAALFLGERQYFRRISAVIIGFAGTVVILRPGVQVIELGALAQLGAAPLFAASLFMSKKLTETEHNGTIVAVMAIFVTLTLLPPALYVWRSPTIEEMIWLFGLAGLATLRHLTMTQAFRCAEVTALQPISFLQLVWATLLGFYAFGEEPDLWTWVGGGIIVTSATYITYREARARNRARAGTSQKGVDRMERRGYHTGLVLILVLAAAVGFRPFEALAVPSADPWPRWRAADTNSPAEIRFAAWDDLLRRYVVASPDGINLFRYAAVTAADRTALTNEVDRLTALPISSFNRSQQLAYWINLYNATTVKMVLAHYPVDTIMDIRISPGLFSFGPWDKKLLRIEGEAVSLNDIEHRILRPLWADPRIHYVLNCASLGCPNLDARAYTAKDMEARLAAAAWAFVNHPRGVRFESGELTVSSIYDWFIADFGGDEVGVLAHLRQYAAPVLKERLAKHGRLDRTAYDWRLNGSD